MQLEQIRTLFDASPAIGLLQARNAPFILDFLNQMFKQSGELVIGHEDLLLKLLLYAEQLHEHSPEELSGPADRYLISWSDSGWLNRHLQTSASEPQYQLTRHSEDAIQFVDQLLARRTGMVGTESRLRLIIDTLTDLVQGSSSDPDKRLANLQEQKRAIQQEIDALQSGGAVHIYRPSQIREQFQLAVSLLKSLQSDFRAVEERFHDIARTVQHDQQAAIESRGDILGGAMDAEDLLKTEDEGVSFYAFISFLFSPDGQQSLRHTIDEVVRLDAIQDQRDAIVLLRSMVKSLLLEADKVLKTNGRLSTSLRRLLDAGSAEDRRQTAEVLRDIKQLACSLKNETPPDECGASVQANIELSSPFSRTFWHAPQSFDNQPADHVVDLENVRRQGDSLASLHLLDLEKLRINIRQALSESGSGISMERLIERFPPQAGVLELVGYFQVAFDDGHSINREVHQHVTIVDPQSGQRTRVRIPGITFRDDRIEESSRLSKGKPR